MVTQQEAGLGLKPKLVGSKAHTLNQYKGKICSGSQSQILNPLHKAAPTFKEC
jgi:hypothetical protein